MAGISAFGVLWAMCSGPGPIDHSAFAAVAAAVPTEFDTLCSRPCSKPRIEGDVHQVLTLRRSLDARQVQGGTAPGRVREQIAAHRERLG